MQCEEFEKLQQSFLDVRKKRLGYIANQTMTAGVEEQMSRAELSALFALIDHREEHGCQATPDTRGKTKLPASRNIGGIIGPY